MEFNEKLMQLRKEKGWSQEILAIKINVTRQTVSKWELKETTPELKKMIEISQLFDISIDSLVGNDTKTLETQQVIHLYNLGGQPYEYISKRKIFNIPLVHINVGKSNCKARGIIAVGTRACGVISLGLLSAGVFSVGLIPVGLVSLGALSFGLLISLGAIAIGTFAFGAISIGAIAVGGLTFGIYAWGGACFAQKIAIGGYADAVVAIGDFTNGEITFNTKDIIDSNVVSDAINQRFPDTPNFISDIIAHFAEISSKSNFR